jgi:hypothetical protein
VDTPVIVAVISIAEAVLGAILAHIVYDRRELKRLNGQLRRVRKRLAQLENVKK